MRSPIQRPLACRSGHPWFSALDLHPSTFKRGDAISEFALTCWIYRGPGDQYALHMSIQELESEVKRLSPSELAVFSKWFERFTTGSVQESEHSAWSDLSAEGLARAYSESEPEYRSADVKRQ